MLASSSHSILYFKTKSQDALTDFKLELSQIKKQESETKLNLQVKQAKSSAYPYISIFSFRHTHSGAVSNGLNHTLEIQKLTGTSDVKYILFRDHKSKQETTIFLETEPQFELLLKKTVGVIAPGLTYNLEVGSTLTFSCHSDRFH